MKNLNVHLKRVRVKDFYTKTSMVTLEAIYSCNNTEKRIMMDTFLKDIDGDMMSLLRHIREREKNENRDDDGEGILDGFTVINIAGDMDAIETKLNFFLGRVRTSMKDVKQYGGSGFLNRVHSIEGMEVSFE